MRKFDVRELVIMSAVINEKQYAFGLDFFKYGSGRVDGWYLNREDCEHEHDTWHYLIMKGRVNRKFFKFCEAVCEEFESIFGFEFDYCVSAHHEWNDYMGEVITFAPIGYFEACEAEYKRKREERKANRETTLGDIEALAQLKRQLEKA